MEWFEIDKDQLIGIICSAAFIFISLLIFIRINGLRSFAKMSAHDFAVTIAIGSILGAVTIQKEPSAVQGLVAIVAFLSLQTLYSYWRRIRPQSYLENKPLLIMDGEKILHENLKKAKMSEDDLIAKLREANVIKMTEIHAVVLESSGDVAVLHGDGDQLDDYLLKDVQR